MKDTIYRQDAIDALWKALYEYEDETEKQFQESEDLDLKDWILHRDFVQNMSDIDRQTILNLPSAQPQWIPYEDDKLPEIDEEICVIDIDDDVYWTHRTKYSDQLYDPFGNKIKNVVGWFPLPKQKGGKNETN